MASAWLEPYDGMFIELNDVNYPVVELEDGKDETTS